MEKIPLKQNIKNPEEQFKNYIIQEAPNFHSILSIRPETCIMVNEVIIDFLNRVKTSYLVLEKLNIKADVAVNIMKSTICSDPGRFYLRELEPPKTSYTRTEKFHLNNNNSSLYDDMKNLLEATESPIMSVLIINRNAKKLF